MEQGAVMKKRSLLELDDVIEEIIDRNPDFIETVRKIVNEGKKPKHTVRVKHVPVELVPWFRQQGYDQAWCSKGYTYEGLNKAWRIDRVEAAPPYHWRVTIEDENLFLLFSLRWT
jgi:hypothetical protein